MGVCNCSMYCCTLLYVHSSIAIILMGKRELIALLNLSSWCLMMVERLFLAVPRGCLQFVIVVFPDHTHLLFLAKLWLVTFNPTKSESLLISQKFNAPIQPHIFMNNKQLTEVTSHKHLGLHKSKDCTWHEQIKYIMEKAWL